MSSSGSIISEEELCGPSKAELIAAEEKRKRGAEWTVEVMAGLLKSMSANRAVHKIVPDPPARVKVLEHQSLSHGDGNVINEVAECIILPELVGAASRDSGATQLHPKVIEELRSYVQTIACLYNNDNRTFRILDG